MFKEIKFGSYLAPDFGVKKQLTYCFDKRYRDITSSATGNVITVPFLIQSRHEN